MLLNNCVILKDNNYDSAINLAILDNKTDNTVYKPWESYFTEGQLYQDKDSYNDSNYTFNIFVGSRIQDFTNYYNQQCLFGVYDNPFTNSEIEDNTYNDVFAIDDSKLDWDNVISNEKNTPLDNTDINVKNYILSPNTSPYEWYSFYVHFVNKYGEISNGIPINDFNLKIVNENDDNNKVDGAIPINELDESGKPVIKDFVNNVVIYSIINQSNLKLLSLTNVKTYDNTYDVKLLSDKIINNFVYNFYFKLNNIPNDFIGYFISYEKIEKTIIHDGFAQYVKDENDNTYYINLFNNKLNYKPAIDFNFNKIVLNDITVNLKDFKDAELNVELPIKQLGLENFVEEILDKQLVVAEESFSDDNDHNTRIKINCTNINNKLKTGSNYFCLLINDFKIDVNV